MPEPPWPHAPTHQLADSGTYFVTASTYQRGHYFIGPKRLAVVQRGLISLTSRFGWRIEAWAVFSNHYHFVAHTPKDASGATTLPILLGELHSKSASWVNRLDQTPGRQVWFNYRETRLTYQRSYLARLNYVHQNPVRHGLVSVANQYPWCSAAWFERTATVSQVRSLYRFKADRMIVGDDYDPTPEW